MNVANFKITWLIKRNKITIRKLIPNRQNAYNRKGVGGGGISFKKKSLDTFFSPYGYTCDSPPNCNIAVRTEAWKGGWTSPADDTRFSMNAQYYVSEPACACCYVKWLLLTESEILCLRSSECGTFVVEDQLPDGTSDSMKQPCVWPRVYRLFKIRSTQRLKPIMPHFHYKSLDFAWELDFVINGTDSLWTVHTSLTLKSFCGMQNTSAMNSKVHYNVMQIWDTFDQNNV